jgi:Tir chaperone protein (CesT) family
VKEMNWRKGSITRVPEGCGAEWLHQIERGKTVVNDLIAGMAQRLGLSLELNEDGAGRLVFEDKYAVDIQVLDDEEHRFYLSSTVGQAEAPSEAELKTLLDANLFGQGTGEAALAFDQDLEEIVLQRSFDVRFTDLDQLMAALEEFVNVAASWTERLAQQGADRSRASAEATALAQGDPSILRI